MYEVFMPRIYFKKTSEAKDGASASLVRAFYGVRGVPRPFSRLHAFGHLDAEASPFSGFFGTEGGNMSVGKSTGTRGVQCTFAQCDAFMAVSLRILRGRRALLLQ